MCLLRRIEDSINAKLYETSTVNDIDVIAKCWPGNSPNVNPIENMSAYLKRAMQQISRNSKEQLWKAVQHHWYSLDRKFCQNLVESMPNRVKSVINRKGHPTKY